MIVYDYFTNNTIINNINNIIIDKKCDNIKCIDMLQKNNIDKIVLTAEI